MEVSGFGQWSSPARAILDPREAQVPFVCPNETTLRWGHPARRRSVGLRTLEPFPQRLEEDSHHAGCKQGNDQVALCLEEGP